MTWVVSYREHDPHDSSLMLGVHKQKGWVRSALIKVISPHRFYAGFLVYRQTYCTRCLSSDLAHILTCGSYCDIFSTGVSHILERALTIVENWHVLWTVFGTLNNALFIRQPLLFSLLNQDLTKDRNRAIYNFIKESQIVIVIKFTLDKLIDILDRHIVCRNKLYYVFYHKLQSEILVVCVNLE